MSRLLPRHLRPPSRLLPAALSASAALLSLAPVETSADSSTAPTVSPQPAMVRTAPAASADRLDPFPRLFSELQLSPEKIQRLRELLRVPEATALEIEAEISRGAYRSRSAALEVYTLACTEAETEIQKLLPPLAYAQFTTVRDELPARRLLDAYDRVLDDTTRPGAAVAGAPATIFPDATFDRLAKAIAGICRRHGITPSATPPPGASRADDLAPYLAAREAADTEIARAIAPFLTAPQHTALLQFQAEQRTALVAVWRQSPERPWAQRR